MRLTFMLISLFMLTALTGCNNNDNDSAQPQIGENRSQINSAGTGNRINTTNMSQQYDNPYHHNYDGEYTGERNTSMTNDTRSAQQVAARASEAAEKVTGVNRATSVVQGMDIVVGIDTNYRGNVQALELKVKRAISRSEQGYNVYVTSDRQISERIRTLFTNMNNVKTSNVTPGIGEIIYDIGQKNGK